MSDNAYMREYMRKRTRARRREVIARLGGSCVKCGATDLLEVDHIDPAAKVSHRFLTWSESRLSAELAKCQLLCRACHWRKTLAHRQAKQRCPR